MEEGWRESDSWPGELSDLAKYSAISDPPVSQKNLASGC